MEKLNGGMCAGSLTITTFDPELYSARRAENSSMKLKECARVKLIVLCITGKNTTRQFQNNIISKMIVQTV